MIYNYTYAKQTQTKHPGILGMSFAAAWSDVWHLLETPVKLAMQGQVTHEDDVLLYLQRGSLEKEESYFSWSMIPIQDDGIIAGIYVPNFDRTKAVISQRRINFLRQQGSRLGIATDLDNLYSNAIEVARNLRSDFPALAFYDCSGSSDAVHGLGSGASESAKTSCTSDEPTHYTFKLASAIGWPIENHELFPEVIESHDSWATDADADTTSSFRKYILRAQSSQKIQIVNPADTKAFAEKTPATELGDLINQICVIPIRTSETKLRAVASTLFQSLRFPPLRANVYFSHRPQPSQTIRRRLRDISRSIRPKSIKRNRQHPSAQ